VVSVAVTTLPILANVALGALFATASFHNYPGGAAALQLHALAPRGASANHAVTVHVDNLGAQTGFSRFSESSFFRYSKVEGLERASDFEGFDFLITENASLHSERFEVLGQPIAQFGGRFSFRPFPAAHTRPALWTMSKRDSKSDQTV